MGNHGNKLYSLIEHHEENVSRGHYTSLMENYGKWLQCNE